MILESRSELPLASYDVELYSEREGEREREREREREMIAVK